MHRLRHPHHRKLTRSLAVRGLTLAALFAIGFVFFACSDDLQQGDPYTVDGVLAMGSPTDRSDSGLCDGALCDAASDAPSTLPVGDAAVDPDNTCATARVLGTLNGDTGADTINGNGTCAEWVSVRATEGSSSAVGQAMRLTFTLTPTGANFDMYVFNDPVKDDSACGMPYASNPVSGTGVETVSLNWGEGTIPNGSDDSRTVDIAIVKADGPCGTGSWTLLVQGNK